MPVPADLSRWRMMLEAVLLSADCAAAASHMSASPRRASSRVASAILWWLGPKLPPSQADRSMRARAAMSSFWGNR